MQRRVRRRNINTSSREKILEAMNFVYENEKAENEASSLSTSYGHAKTLCDDNHRIALDSALPSNFTDLRAYGMQEDVSDFLGYPFLQRLAQSPLVSAGVETTADEMTREWGKVIHNGTKETKIANEEKIHVLEAALKTYNVQEVFREIVEKIGYYGGCLVYIDAGISIEETENPLLLHPSTFKKGSLKHFQVIDPINCMPGMYNTMHPFKKDYFVPTTWNILGTTFHASRFLYCVGKEAPLLYKPSYNFFGVSQAQLAWDYVLDFAKNKKSASKLLNRFSTTVLKTNMQNAMKGKGTASIIKRVNFFNNTANNQGCFVMDKEDEDLIKVDTPLSGVTDIVRQSLEVIASVFRIPAVKFLGISPGGFNATGESDIRNFYDYMQSLQQKQLSAHMETVLKILQLNAFGEIDENIVFEWSPLGGEDKRLQAEINKIKSETMAMYINARIITREEAREALASDKEGMFTGIDPDDVGDNVQEGYEDELTASGEESWQQ